MKNTVDDRLSNQCDVIQEEPEDIGARPADFVRICSHLFAPQLTLRMQADLHEEQNPDVENPQEAVEIAEAGAKPRDGRFSLTILIIVCLPALF
jgi:hypothetical protein